MNRNFKRNTALILGGLAVGVAAGMLLAPKSGKGNPLRHSTGRARPATTGAPASGAGCGVATSIPPNSCWMTKASSLASGKRKPSASNRRHIRRQQGRYEP